MSNEIVTKNEDGTYSVYDRCLGDLMDPITIRAGGLGDNLIIYTEGMKAWEGWGRFTLSLPAIEAIARDAGLVAGFTAEVRESEPEKPDWADARVILASVNGEDEEYLVQEADGDWRRADGDWVLAEDASTELSNVEVVIGADA